MKNKKKTKKVILIAIFIILIVLVILGTLYYSRHKSKPNGMKIDIKPIVEKQLTVFDEKSNKRPIAVMIDNNVDPDSHKGLQDAYLTYECIVEGGLTRIMAIFKDVNTSTIGPVRSSRHYFLDYALESDAIYAHFGWSKFAQNDIKSLGVNNLNGLYDKGFWRDSHYVAPHNAFTSIEKIYSAAKGKKYRTTSDDWMALKYDVDQIYLEKKYTTKTTNEEGKEVTIISSDVKVANNISMTYSPSQKRSYIYNKDKEYYLRSTNGHKHTDATTKQQYHYKNIIIEKVKNKTLDSYGRQDLDTTGTGDGYFITNGYAIPIKWNKTLRKGKTTYTYKDEEIKVNDGNTIIQVVPINNNVTIN